MPEGIIVLWSGSTIPENWTRLTGFDDALIRLSNSPNLSPTGSWTHTHSNGSLSSVSDHTHALTHRTNSGTSGSSGNRNSGAASADGNHTHDFPNLTTTSAGGHSHSLGSTHSASHYPPYRKLYMIKSTSMTPLPVGAILPFTEPLANRPTFFNHCNGSTYDGVATPNLRDRFPLGATSGDLGNSGGSTSHSHSQPNVNSGGSHSHTFSGTVQGGGYVGVYAVPQGAVPAIGSHEHYFGNELSTDSAHSHSVSDTGSSSHVPLYVMLHLLMLTHPAGRFKEGICAFVDNASNIPQGWSAVSTWDGRHLRGANSDSDLKSTGGSSSHNHSVGGTTGSRSAHSHGGSVSSGNLSYASNTFEVHQYSPGESTAAGHSHSAGSLNVSAGNAHSHNLSATTNSTAITPKRISLTLIRKDA